MVESIRLRELVATWEAVRATSARLEKRACMAAQFARLAPDDLRLAASYLAGEVPQGALQVGWRTLQAAEHPPRAEDLPLFQAADPESAHPTPEAGPDTSPTLAELDAHFEALQRIGGPGAEPRRVARLARVFAGTGPTELEFLRGLLLGELRQGALRALVIEALAEALALPAGALRRAIMFAGDFGTVVLGVARDGALALERFGPQPLVPIEPMLAATAASPTEALSVLGPAAIEWKLDGVRVQLHRDGDSVRAFSRQLRDVTPLVPELVALGRRFAATSFILDGEAVATEPDGRPVPFQDLMRRLTSESDAEERARGESAPLGVLFFDLLFLDGVALPELPYRERRALLEHLVPSTYLVPSVVAESADDAERFYAEALARGHEGVVLKALEAPYDAGRRGAQWRKVKPAITLDLVILAAEWGHGRRRGWLSNLHLGAPIPAEPGRFAMLGRTFKGLSDTMLQEITSDLLTIATTRDADVVHVQPLRVVEIAFDGLQRSPRYDSGLALRFARVKRLRPDKSAAEATPLDEVRALHASRQGRSA